MAAMNKASFITRGGASMIDSLVLLVPTTIVSFVPVLGPLVIQWGYFIILTNNWEGATLGKWYFGIKVATSEEKRPKLSAIILRETIGKTLSVVVFGLGYLWVIWNKEKQSWHDMMAKTYVYQVKPLTSGKQVLAWVLVLVFPTVPLLGILAAVLILSINPQAQVEKAKLQQEYYNNNDRSTQILDEDNPALQTQ